MACNFLTCPETAHLELVDIEADPLGNLIVACSRFRPAQAVDCPRTCAVMLDRRARGVAAATRSASETTSVEKPRVLHARSLMRA